MGAAEGLVNTGGCISAPPGSSHTGGARSSSSTQGMTAPFRLLPPSGIWGVIEIIYQLMRADGLIKQNRKAFAAALSVSLTQGRGTLGVTCQMCPWPSAGCPAWSPDAGVQAAFGVSYVGIQDPDFGSRFLPQPLPGQPEQVPAHTWAKASGSWAVLPDLQLDPPRGCWALGVQSPRELEAKLLRSGVHGGRGYQTPGLPRRLRSWS